VTRVCQLFHASHATNEALAACARCSRPPPSPTQMEDALQQGQQQAKLQALRDAAAVARALRQKA